jgi:hypothetical protein
LGRMELNSIRMHRLRRLGALSPRDLCTNDDCGNSISRGECFDARA